MLNNYISETIKKRRIKLVYYQIGLCEDASKENVFFVEWNTRAHSKCGNV